MLDAHVNPSVYSHLFSRWHHLSGRWSQSLPIVAQKLDALGHILDLFYILDHPSLFIVAEQHAIVTEQVMPGRLWRAFRWNICHDDMVSIWHRKCTTQDAKHKVAVVAASSSLITSSHPSRVVCRWSAKRGASRDLWVGTSSGRRVGLRQIRARQTRHVDNATMCDDLLTTIREMRAERSFTTRTATQGLSDVQVYFVIGLIYIKGEVPTFVFNVIFVIQIAPQWTMFCIIIYISACLPIDYILGLT